ncbi:MAG TPA: alpha-amylase [Planctomycetaceae bacterium]|nr:alpha-amylase [Planctomycetaceae bacterium]
MPNPIRFSLLLHNHQPVGNFEHVFEQTYQESYLPFLDVFERYDAIKIALHTSGSLMEWLDARHPEYVDRLAHLVRQGRVEIIGGPYYEPILAMLPSRDRLGQIRSYTNWLEKRLGAAVRGMWVPERVWEQSYTRDLVDAGIEYTVLDDFHFKAAGLADSELTGHFVTEDDGRVMCVFPGSERLRYLIPFGSPEQIVEHLGQIAEHHPGAVVVFGDDGEKFGSWPETHKHVYGDRWLERFFDALTDHRDWIHTTTLADAVDNVAPAGKIYLPDCSYREMTEWALPAARQIDFEELSHEIGDNPHWPALRQFVRGGFWRNFKIRYPESDEMYSRMMHVSRRLSQTAEMAERGESVDWSLLDAARAELYRGQCNCAYWHGAFGGIYLPHLRNAIFEHLISAENLLNRANRRPESWIESNIDDFNCDSYPEIHLANDRLAMWIAPNAGGQIYELDVRPIRHNLLATLTRRPEAYHQKVLRGANYHGEQCASIHDRVVFKQEGLDKCVQYDAHPRKSLLDLFYPADASIESVASGEAEQLGDFTTGRYDARVRRNPDRIQVELSREGRVADVAVRLVKTISLDAGGSSLEITYSLEGLSPDASLHFAPEFNFAGLPANVDGRFFRDASGRDMGHLGTINDLANLDGLGLVDHWLGIDIQLKPSRPTHFWTFPVNTVSQSEGGFELVHQSVVVQPHWHVRPDADGCWRVTLRMDIDTSHAENHRKDTVVVATS